MSLLLLILISKNEETCGDIKSGFTPRADSLPKTRSGKIMRRIIKSIIEGEDIGDIFTLEDRTAVEAILRAVKGGV